MHTVVINRKKWLRGEQNSKLRKPNGKKCCIGFLATALGATNRQITNISTLEEICGSNKRYIDFNMNYSYPLAEAYDTNDDSSINDTVREKKLRTIGKQMGVRFQFIN